MSPEEALIRGVEADPTADLPRLVYADWLDENGRGPFADFLRTELELSKLPLDSPAAPPLRERLWQAWAAVDATWLHRFTQPRMLRANPTPFPAGWLGFGMGTRRPWQGTYSGDYHTLPPLPVGEFLGTFDYLGPPPTLNGHQVQSAPQRQQQLAEFQRQAGQTGLRLPSGFVEFMGHPSLQFAIRSIPNLDFALPTKTNPIRPAESGRAVHALFYADWQDCLLWDLFLHPGGAHCVIARDLHYFTSPGREGWFVAPSFEAFVYREWMEERIWYHQNPHHYAEDGIEPQPLTPVIQAYIDHYRSQANGVT